MMNSQPDARALEHSQVVVFPPVIPLTGFLLGVLMELMWPTAPSITAGVRAVLRGMGGILFCVGAAGFAWMVVTMKTAGTPIHNAATPTVLVERGPFGFTRNPMYLFGTIGYAGLALMLLMLWALAFLPAVFALTHYGVVLREEAFLARRFGRDYTGYQSRVRRWL